MSNIGKSTIKQIGDRKVVCSELTVAQVRALLQPKSCDVVDEILLDEVRVIDLPIFTDLTAEELEQMYPSDLEVLVEGCKEANPSFCRMLAKVAKAQTPA